MKIQYASNLHLEMQNNRAGYLSTACDPWGASATRRTVVLPRLLFNIQKPGNY